MASCAGGGGDKLPILGQREAVTKQVDGKTVTDSVYHTIPDFAFVSQYGDTVTAKTLAGKVYVADFFFTSCPTICPKMKTQLKRVYEQFGKDNRVVLLSHTIDPSHDTVPVLKAFADQLGVTDRNWLFVTGDRDKIYDIGQNSSWLRRRPMPRHPAAWSTAARLSWSTPTATFEASTTAPNPTP